MKRCHVEALLERYLDGELPPVQVTAVAAHFAACRSCRDRWQALSTCKREVQVELHWLPNPVVAPDFDVRVVEAVFARQSSVGLLERLDAGFAEPLYKLLATTVLGALWGSLLVAGVLLSSGTRLARGSALVLPIGTPGALPALTVGGTVDHFASGEVPVGVLPNGAETANAAIAVRRTLLVPARGRLPAPPLHKIKEGSSWHDATSVWVSSSPSGSWC